MSLRPGSILAIVLAAALTAQAGAAPPSHATAPKASPASPLLYDTGVRFDANELSVGLSNFGTIARDYEGNLGLEWPQGSGQRLIHGAGLWLVGNLFGSPRSAMADYGSEYTPGITDFRGNASDPYGESQTNYVYKITRADLTNPGRDWKNWPLDQGAPVDAFGAPQLIGDQTLYCTFNDSYGPAHDLIDGSVTPLQAEVHETIFGYSRQISLARTMFVHYWIKNRSTFRWPEFYAGIWVDPDIGDPYDDFAGADSALAGAYAYDSEPSGGAEPSPTVGVCVLLDSLKNTPQPPIYAISSWSVDQDPQSYAEALNLVRGRDHRGVPWYCTADSRFTQFPYGGDPVTGTGCLDLVPGDKRLLISTGPFDVPAGGTIDLVVAFVVGSKAGATSVKDNVADLRDAFQAARQAWLDTFSQVLPVPTTPALTAGFPNPSRDVSYFDFSLPTGVKPERIEVLDLRGRVVWQEPTTLLHDGYFRLHWDGRTLDGVPARSGTYFFRLITDRGPLTRKVVRLR